MKRNLIIFLFTLLLGGLTCFNYSYASTVNVPESVCKKIQDSWWEWKTLTEYQQDPSLTKTMNAQEIEQKYNETLWQKQQECLQAWCIMAWKKCVACPWIRLNTDIPFIWNCIPTDSQSEIFPVFIGWLIKFATSLLLLVGFICIIVGGVMVACGKDKEGKDLIKKVVYAMALLWASWVILKMINPNFFN